MGFCAQHVCSKKKISSSTQGRQAGTCKRVKNRCPDISLVIMDAIKAISMHEEIKVNG